MSSLDVMLVWTKEPLSDEDILAGLLTVDIDDQHESNEGGSLSEVFEVLVKPNLPQVLDTLMNYLMVIGTAELQGMTVKASRLM